MDPLTNEIIGQLVQEWEQLAQGGRQAFLLGGTSDPTQVDPAILDCFQEQIEIVLSGYEAGLNLFRQLLGSKKLSFPVEDATCVFDQLNVKRMMDSKDIEAFVQSAEHRALLRAIRNGGPEHYSIELTDFPIPEP